jgi:hypothetical protein
MKGPRKGSALAASAAAIGLAAAVTACSGPGSTSTAHSGSSPEARASASTAATTAPDAVPAGYKRVGGTAQGVSMAVPGSWLTINFAQQTLRQAIKKIGINGVSQSTLAQDLQGLQKLHGIYDIDAQSISSSPSHFATNISGYCTNSGISQSGSAGVPLLRQSAASQLQQISARHITQTDVEVGGVPGVRTAYTISTTAAGTLRAAQLEVLPKSGRVCFITLTAGSAFPSAVLATAAATAEYP